MNRLILIGFMLLGIELTVYAADTVKLAAILIGTIAGLLITLALFLVNFFLNARRKSKHDPQKSMIVQLQRITRLKDNDLISEDEFQTLKGLIINEKVIINIGVEKIIKDWNKLKSLLDNNVIDRKEFTKRWTNRGGETLKRFRAKIRDVEQDQNESQSCPDPE